MSMRVKNKMALDNIKKLTQGAGGLKLKTADSLKALFLDFEFNDTSEKTLNLVCVVAHVEDEKHAFWLHNDIREQLKFNKFIETYIEQEYYFVSFAAIAEVRALLSLPYPPEATKMLWIDLWVEYRCLLNHHNKTLYGNQLIAGKIKKTHPPSPKWLNASNENSSKPEDNYAACCFKLLGVEIDTDNKKLMRDIIISRDENEIEKNREKILEYCNDDVKYLLRLLNKIVNEYKSRYPKKLHGKIREWMLSRGEFAARTAVMERDGYPINYTYTKNFSDNVSSILGDIQGEINALFPDIKPYKYNAKTGIYSWDQKITREWIRTSLPSAISDNWPRTNPTKKYPEGQLSLSVDSFNMFFGFRHNYPKDNLGAQFVRYLKTKQNLNGFSANTKKKSLWDSVGRDHRVRPYTNIYRSQSSRSQPSTTAFIFLKAAWMRSLVQPKKGWCMGGIDYGSEEFLIGGLESGDDAMVEAYNSGDVYLWFGKACKRIPQEATKKSHSALRNRFKSSVLGIQYLMGATSLAIKIANDTGEVCTEEEAQEYIDLFDEIFWRYSEYRDEILEKYREDGFLLLADGWTMWGDNSNFRSVCNCPIQGMGAVIMRKAVQLAQQAGLGVSFTLHDALYILFRTEDFEEKMSALAECMDKAFKFYYPNRDDVKVRLDGNAWSPDFDTEEIHTTTSNGLPIKTQQIYIDERSAGEYKQFSKYFVRDEILDLL